MSQIKIDLLILDFDGVLTDNRVYITQDGKEAVACHRGDGWGIRLLKNAGLEIIILSTETNPVVSARAKKLGVECIQGCSDKAEATRAIIAKKELEYYNAGGIFTDKGSGSKLRTCDQFFSIFGALFPEKKQKRGANCAKKPMTTKYGAPPPDRPKNQQTAQQMQTNQAKSAPQPTSQPCKLIWSWVRSGQESDHNALPPKSECTRPVINAGAIVSNAELPTA